MFKFAYNFIIPEGEFFKKKNFPIGNTVTITI